MTREQLIAWAIDTLIEEGRGRQCRFYGETELGFYITFWNPDPARDRSIGPVELKQALPIPGGSSCLFVSRQGYVLLRLGMIPAGMYDLYLREGKLIPIPLLDSDGVPVQWKGLNQYGVDANTPEEMVRELHRESAAGIKIHEKYALPCELENLDLLLPLPPGIYR